LYLLPVLDVRTLAPRGMPEGRRKLRQDLVQVAAGPVVSCDSLPGPYPSTRGVALLTHTWKSLRGTEL